MLNGRGNTDEHRLPAAPLDLRPQGRAARRAALRRAALREARQHAAAELEAACCSTARATSAPTWPRVGLERETSTSAATCSTTSRSHECQYNWKTFIEVYLEDYHVEPFHPGLGQLRRRARTCAGTSANGSRCRPSGIHQGLRRPGSPVYQRWHEQVLQFSDGRVAASTAPIWLTYFPNVMVEWYPHVLVVSHAGAARSRSTRPTSSSSTTPRRSCCSSASSSRPSGPRTWRPASRTTRSRCGWTPAGGRCSSAARTEVGPYQSPMEDGMQHFHEFYRRRMGFDAPGESLPR